MSLIETISLPVQVHSFTAHGFAKIFSRENPQLQLIGRLLPGYRIGKRKLYLFAEHPNKMDAYQATRQSREATQSWFLANPPTTGAAQRRFEENELSLAVMDALEGSITAERAPGTLFFSDLKQALIEAHVPETTDQKIASELRQLGWRKFDRVMVRGKKYQVWLKGAIKDLRGAIQRIRLEDSI